MAKHQKAARIHTAERVNSIIASVLLLGAQAAFWLSFLLLPFSAPATGYQFAALLIHPPPFLQISLMDDLFFLYPLSMALALIAWSAHVRRAGGIALLALVPVASDLLRGDTLFGVGFWVSVAAIAISAVSALADEPQNRF